MNVNSNDISLDRYRGEIKPCPLCANRTPNAALDALTSGRVCSMCLGHGSIAMCTNCDGTGSYKGKTIWDGGRNDHASTCTPCGGKGCFPSRIAASVAVDTPKVIENQAATVA